MMRQRKNGNKPYGSVTKAFEEIRQDYEAARDNRFRTPLTGVVATGTNADWHMRILSDFFRIIERSRFIDRNDPIIGQAATRLCTNALQLGTNLEPMTGDVKADRYIREKFKDWSEDPYQCDLEEQKTFHEIAFMSLRATIVDGDIIHLPLKSGHLQTLEAHRLRSPDGQKKNMLHGVQLDDMRRRISYFLTKSDANPNSAVYNLSDMIEYGTRDKDGNLQVFHVYDPKRISQTRGITAIAPVVDMIGMHSDIQFAKLVQQQMVSCFGIIRERQAGPAYPDDDLLGSEDVQQLDDGNTRLIEEITPGMELVGAPGESIKSFNSAIPNAEYFDHVKLILTIIAVNLGMPVHLLLLDPSDTNFSSWRGAIDQARTGFLRLWKMMTNRLHRPTFQWKMRQWLASDPQMQRFAKRLGSDMLRHRWSPPKWNYIDPQKDANAEASMIESRLKSRRSVLAMRGDEIEDTDAEIVADNMRLIMSSIEAAQSINDKYPDATVDWREVLNLTVKPTERITSAPKPTETGAATEPDTDDQPDDKSAKPAKKKGNDNAN